MPTITPPVLDIVKTNYLPFQMDDPVLEALRLEVYWDFAESFGHGSDASVIENDDTYTPPQKYLVACVIAIRAINKYGSQNLAGTLTSAGKEPPLKEVEAGSVKVVFGDEKVNTENTGKDFKTSYENVLDNLYAEAQLKAEKLGFILDISRANPTLINAYQQPDNIIDFMAF